MFMKGYSENLFIFSPRYRLLRHLVFWAVHILIFTFIFWPTRGKYGAHLLLSTMWAILAIIYSYPVMYWIIPRYLLKEKYYSFVFIMLLWAIAGWFWNFICRTYIYFPFSALLKFSKGTENPWAPGSYLMMNVMTGFGSIIVLFKYWMLKQKEFLSAEKERANAELQLLKAQLHPHFLFNTLNNIYSFALQKASKTPELVIKLSSLLSYVLYDCMANEVLLEKELQVMENYIDLEKERYVNLDVSLNMEGDIRERWIAPLLLLPFLENAFKHGTSEQLEKPWLSMDISVKQNMLRCKIANSKNDSERFPGTVPNENGIGILNVKKRLAYWYPGRHELKVSDEGNFFVVSLSLELDTFSAASPQSLIAT